MSKGVIHLVLETIRALADYWATEYDWRPVEAGLQALNQFVTEIDGVDIHFISTTATHQRGRCDRLSASALSMGSRGRPTTCTHTCRVFSSQGCGGTI